MVSKSHLSSFIFIASLLTLADQSLVTLSAFSAAFAAVSTALLCVVILNGRPGDNLLQGSIQTIDAPRSTQSLTEQRQYGRRTITLNKEKARVEESPALEGVAWLMVRS